MAKHNPPRRINFANKYIPKYTLGTRSEAAVNVEEASSLFLAVSIPRAADEGGMRQGWRGCFACGL